ncbi:MAG TPA: AAA family ATPase [Phycisphaerae bacterium]
MNKGQPQAPDSAPDSLLSTALARRAGGGDLVELEPFGAGPETARPARAINLRAMLRWKWTIALTFLIVTGSTVPLIWVLVDPIYTAQAAVYVRSYIPKVLYKTDENGLVPNYQQRQNTQAFILRSGPVLEQVLDDAEVKQTAWDNEEERTLLGESLTKMERLRAGLSVTPAAQSEVITVAMKARKPSDAKVIVNAVIKSYQGYTSARTNENDLAIIAVNEQTNAKTRKEIDELLRQRALLANEVGALDAQQLRTSQAMHRDKLEDERNDLDRALKLLRWQQEALSAPRRAAAEPAAARPYDKDEEWRTLERKLQDARHELEKAGRQFGESHPRILGLQDDVRHAEELLHERQAQLDQSWETAVAGVSEHPGGGALALPDLIQRKQKEMDLLESKIEEQKDKVKATGDAASRLDKLDEDLARLRDEEKLTLARLQALVTESKAPLEIRADLAAEPARPDRDRRILFSIGALIAALGLGLGLAYLRATWDPKLRELGDVGSAAQAPFLGQLPELPTRVDPALEVDPLLTESIRMVRTALLARFPDSACRAVLVTSSSPQAGKSTLAVLLARSLASLGKRVLLVEADFHHPCLARRLQLDCEAGLAMLLAGHVNDARAIQHTAVSKFDLLPVGPATPEVNTDTLANGDFAACMRRWRAAYDFILLDSPPMRPVADARILARHADGTIMLLRSSHCHKVEVLQSYADLSAAGGTLLGTVLIGGESRPYHYDAYSYRGGRYPSYLPQS